MHNLQKIGLMALILFASSCSTLHSESSSKASVAKNTKDSATSGSESTLVHVKCINQNFSNESNLLRFEKKFVVVLYKKLKIPAKDPKEDQDDTSDLYSERVIKMAEKVLTDAGLQKAKPSDKNVLTVGLTWATRKKPLNALQVYSFLSNDNARNEFAKSKRGEVFLNTLFMKAVGPDKKTARWEIELESINTNTFYLDLMPRLLLAGKDSLGKTCDSIIEKTVPDESPELDAIRRAK